MKRFRIAVVAACPFPYPRGTPVRAVRLSEALAHLGHRVHVATYHVGVGGLDPRLKVARIRAPSWVRPFAPGPTVGKLALLDPLLAVRLRRMLERQGPFDVIHAHHYEGLILALAARAGGGVRLPVVYDAHALLTTELPDYASLLPPRLVRACGGWFDRALPRLADHVIAVSEPLQSRLIAAGLKPARISAIGNGLEDNAFAELPPRPEPPADGGTVVYAGNLAAYHRLDLLLEAFARLLAARPLARLKIYTAYPADNLLTRAHKLGIASNLDVADVPFPDVCQWMARCDVAVNPRPICDGVPQKNLNYMAAGLPLVAFRASLHPYLDGVHGIAVERPHAEDLAAALASALDQPAQLAEWGAAARRTAEKSLSWRATAMRVTEVYEELLSGTGRR